MKPLFNSYGVRITLSKIIIEKNVNFVFGFGFHPNFCRLIFSFFFSNAIYILCLDFQFHFYHVRMLCQFHVVSISFPENVLVCSG